MGPPGAKTNAIRPRQHQGDWSLGKASQAPLEEVEPCTLETEQALETHCRIQEAWRTPGPATGPHPGPSQLQRASSTCLPTPAHSSAGDPSLKISPRPLEYLCGADTRACTWQRTPVPAGDLTAGSSVLAQRGSEHAAALESRCHGKEPRRFKPRFSPLCNGSRCSIYLYGVGRRLPQEHRGKVPNVEGMTPPRQRCGDGGGGGGPAGGASSVSRLKFNQPGKNKHCFVATEATQMSWTCTVQGVSHASPVTIEHSKRGRERTDKLPVSEADCKEKTVHYLVCNFSH